MEHKLPVSDHTIVLSQRYRCVSAILFKPGYTFAIE